MRRARDLSAVSDGYDLVVIGAGPAGLGATAKAASCGLSVLLVDENAEPGGQIYRAVTSSRARRDVFGQDYWQGADLVRRVAATHHDFAPGTTVWTVEPGGVQDAPAFQVGLSSRGSARMIGARHLILATGAIERPFPIPGWTLPGVMTAGAAQIALKSSALVPSGRVVLAGSGPLFHLLGAQLTAAGATIVAMLDTTPRANWRSALPALPDFLLSGLFLKGLGLLVRSFLGHRPKTEVTALAAEGDGKVEAVRFTRAGRSETIPCDMLLLHHGVIPNIAMPHALGCAQDWNADQHCWAPRVDEWFASSLPGLSIAGDGAGIGGAEAAVPSGELAALDAAFRLGRFRAGERDAKGADIRARLARAMRGRRFVDLLYRPAQSFLAPQTDEVVVCRCEEVTAGQIRKTVADLGVRGPNQLKAFLRCGMGPCQGRLCGATVTEIIAKMNGVSPAEVGHYRLRPPFKPITVGEMACLPQTETARKAVIRS